MADSDDLEILEDEVLTAAAGPKQVTSDGVTVVAHSLTEKLDAADRLRGRVALQGGLSAWGALRPARVVPPGSIGPGNTETE